MIQSYKLTIEFVLETEDDDENDYNEIAYNARTDAVQAIRRNSGRITYTDLDRVD